MVQIVVCFCFFTLLRKLLFLSFSDFPSDFPLRFSIFSPLVFTLCNSSLLHKLQNFLGHPWFFPFSSAEPNCRFCRLLDVIFNYIPRFFHAQSWCYWVTFEFFADCPNTFVLPVHIFQSLYVYARFSFVFN